MAEQTLAEQINAVNAYADYLQGEYITRDRSQFPTRNPAVVALRNAAQDVLYAAQDWPEIEKRDGQHLVLQAPDGTLVLYTAVEGAERLALVIETPAALPVGLCDYCAANLPADYLTISVGEESHYVCSSTHARQLADLQPGAALRFEARSAMDRYQFRIESREEEARTAAEMDLGESE